jgi:uncharacterized protein YvpB
VRRHPGRGAFAGIAVVAIAGWVGGCESARDAQGPGGVAAHAWGERLAGHAQARSLSCEARSACDLLAAHGIAVAEDAFFQRLPKSGNPDLGFVGDVDGPSGNLPPDGYGVHAEPVAATLREFGLDAQASRERDLAWLVAELEASRPVIVWVTAGFMPPNPVEMRDASGRAFTAERNEHTCLAIGHAGGRVVLIDPATGESTHVRWGAFDASWAGLRRMAVSASGKRAPRPEGAPLVSSRR